MRTLAELVKMLTQYHGELVWEREGVNDAAPAGAGLDELYNLELGRKRNIGHHLRGPLLVTLDDAVGSSSGSGGGGVARSKEPANIAAMKLRNEIQFAMKADLARVSPRDPALAQFTPVLDRVVAWHKAFAHTPSQTGATPGEEAAWVEQLTEWVEAIMLLVDPRQRLEVMEPCPICKNERYSNEDDELVRALSLWWARGDGLATATLECRACHEVLGEGYQAIRNAVTMYGLDSLEN